MKLSKDTLNILKNYASINPGIMLKPGNHLMTKSINNVVYAETTIDDTIDFELGIYDLSNFLSVLALLGDDSDIVLDNATSIATITNGKSKIYYTAADASTVVSPSKAIQFPVSDVIFEINGEDFTKLTRAARTLSIDTLAITADQGKILINGYNKTVDQELLNVLYSFECSDYDGTAEFNFLINMANMKMLADDYKVMISSKGAIKFEGKTSTYIVVLEIGSKYTA